MDEFRSTIEIANLLKGMNLSLKKRQIIDDNCQCSEPTLGHRNAMSTKLEAVTVLVSAEQVPFAVARDDLSAVSHFFRGALKMQPHGEILESIDLKHAQVVHFRQFYEWLQSRRIFSHSGTITMELIFRESRGGWHAIKADEVKNLQESDGETSGQVNIEASQAAAQLVQLYAFADEYDVPLLRHDIVNMLLVVCGFKNRHPALSMVNLTYSAVPRTSMLAKLMLDWYIARTTFEEIALHTKTGRDHIVTELWQDLTRKMCEKAQGKSVDPHKRPCEYHEKEPAKD